SVGDVPPGAPHTACRGVHRGHGRERTSRAARQVPVGGCRHVDGLENSRDLPHACTMNGRCQEVCPVDIPLPTLMRGWRNRSWREGLEPLSTRSGLRAFSFVASNPRLYRFASAAAVRLMRLFGRRGWIHSMPLAGAWTSYRDLPR